MKEIWKKIEFVDGKYEISNFGNVRNLNFHRERKVKQLKAVLNSRNFLVVSLPVKGTFKVFPLHRLVAEHFIFNYDNLPQVNHIDGNRHNNRVDNLEWCTFEENMEHALKNNLMKRKKINQYDLDGNFIKTWESIRQAKKYYQNNHIGEVLNKVNKTACGFIWRSYE